MRQQTRDATREIVDKWKDLDRVEANTEESLNSRHAKHVGQTAVAVVHVPAAGGDVLLHGGAGSDPLLHAVAEVGLYQVQGQVYPSASIHSPQAVTVMKRCNQNKYTNCCLSASLESQSGIGIQG